MAQIKNIKKPGDLIRGADVGLAALDKDGNVIGYKAAAADAGKVLTVGEDGSITPETVEPASSVSFLTVAPTEPNANGLKFVVLSEDPPVKYNGYIYIITE